MSDRPSTLSLSDHLALLERQEEANLRGVISGQHSRTLRTQLATPADGSQPFRLPRVPPVSRSCAPEARWA